MQLGCESRNTDPKHVDDHFNGDRNGDHDDYNAHPARPLLDRPRAAQRSFSATRAATDKHGQIIPKQEASDTNALLNCGRVFRVLDAAVRHKYVVHV